QNLKRSVKARQRSRIYKVKIQIEERERSFLAKPLHTRRFNVEVSKHDDFKMLPEQAVITEHPHVRKLTHCSYNDQQALSTAARSPSRSRCRLFADQLHC